MCSKVLQGKSLSQVDPDQEDDEAATEELAELDTFLISACEDLVSALASVLGADFAPTFKEFLPLIAQYYVCTLYLYSSKRSKPYFYFSGSKKNNHRSL